MEDERGPGLDFTLCFVCGSRPRGAAAFLLCLFILLLNVFECSPVPPPSSRTYLLRYIGAETREEGGTRCQRALAAEWDRVLRRSGSRKWRRPPVAARSGGAGAKEEQVGRKTRCRAPGTRRGGCHPRGSGGVAAVRQWAGACCHPPGWWRSRERGTRCRLPSTGGAIAGRQEAEGASGRPPKRSSTIAWHRE